MFPQTTTTPPAAAATSPLMKSPIAYVFGGLTLLLGAICVSLIVLACLSLKRRLRFRSSSDEEKQITPMVLSVEEDREEKMVVIMAGENRPSCIAVPVKNIN
ncbi:unnamed protein product [Rhodiola kirilowii]